MCFVVGNRTWVQRGPKSPNLAALSTLSTLPKLPNTLPLPTFPTQVPRTRNKGTPTAYPPRALHIRRAPPLSPDSPRPPPPPPPPPPSPHQHPPAPTTTNTLTPSPPPGWKKSRDANQCYGDLKSQTPTRTWDFLNETDVTEKVRNPRSQNTEKIHSAHALPDELLLVHSRPTVQPTAPQGESEGTAITSGHP